MFSYTFEKKENPYFTMQAICLYTTQFVDHLKKEEKKKKRDSWAATSSEKIDSEEPLLNIGCRERRACTDFPMETKLNPNE